jgi:hypothetical protein
MNSFARRLHGSCCSLGLIVALLSLASCGDKETDTKPLAKPATRATASAPAESSAGTAPSASPPAAPKAGAPAPEAVPATAQAQADMVASNVNHEITGAMHQYIDKKGALPDRLDQLVAEGFIKKLPAPPAGKRFFINTNNLQVEMVDR